MIWESCYWKDPLLEMADRLVELIRKEEWTEEDGAQFERDIFIGFYSVRKLFEAPAKVSDETRALKLNLFWYPKKPEAGLVDWYNRGDFWELYDLDERHGEERDPLFLAHRLVHSFIFTPSAAFENNPDGVFFTSDTDKEQKIYFVELSEIVRLFREVGEDYPDIETHRDPVTGEMKVRAFRPVVG